ncbi:carboxypeptidase regulatory-like domain-containing protein [Nocardioides sp. CN2-186]|uniref:MSCRAMM family protein n=1 Tax=Nocardioides tweenelious TaxID=3156607 RepID=UPI0032B3935C
MPRTTRHATSVLLLVVGLIASAALVLLQAPAADAASAGRVRGYVVAPHDDRVPLRMAWFTTDWKYLGSKSVSGNGAYSLTLPVGTYRLQFTDKRPSYDVTKFAPTDATVTVRSGSTAVRNVRLHRGAAITGTVRTAGGSGAHATVTAANKAQQSFTTIANDKGQFAIGGLPEGSYSVFTYDHKKTYVAKSTFVKKLEPGHPQNVDIKLKKRAGNLLVDLYAGDRPINGTLMVTAISKKTGQFWTMKARNGTAAFKGVYPGRYTLIVPGYQEFFGKTGTVSRGKVHAGRTAFGSFRLTQHGGAFTGRLVAGDDGTPVGKATVRLYAPTGDIVAVTTTAADGTFRVGGSLGTMTSVSLIAFDGANMQYYDTLRLRALSIKVSETKNLGDLELPAKPSASVVGTVVDASNKAVALGGATVQLKDAKGVVIGTTVSAADGSFTIDKKLLPQTGVSVVVAPTGTSSYLGVAPATCQYVSTSHAGIVLEADVERDLGVVGISRKSPGTCNIPVGDPVTR